MARVLTLYYYLLTWKKKSNSMWKIGWIKEGINGCTFYKY